VDWALLCFGFLEQSGASSPTKLGVQCPQALMVLLPISTTPLLPARLLLMNHPIHGHKFLGAQSQNLWVPEMEMGQWVKWVTIFGWVTGHGQ